MALVRSRQVGTSALALTEMGAAATSRRATRRTSLPMLISAITRKWDAVLLHLPVVVIHLYALGGGVYFVARFRRYSVKVE